MTPTLPSWVLKRDGRKEPFDADKISQALFAATEAAGSPNAFLARELTDGVLHFLAQEEPVETIGAVQIAELVEKVVRELGQPEVAQRIGQGASKDKEDSRSRGAHLDDVVYSFSINTAPEAVVDSCLRLYGLHAVFGRDLAAAHAAGLLQLTWLQRPCMLKEAKIPPPQDRESESPWHRGWTHVRDGSSDAGLLIVDGVELIFSVHGKGWLEGFLAALEAYDRRAQLHVRVSPPPSWAREPTLGPLFETSPPERVVMPRHELVAFLSAFPKEDFRRADIHWHLCASDFEDQEASRVLTSLVEPELLAQVTFVFDRAQHSEKIAHRLSPATLMQVQLRLAKFLELPEVAADPSKMLAKLPSLVRMAISAGVQKRNYLRRHSPQLSRGFLLDRARLVIQPLDLDSAVQQLVGARPDQSNLAQNAARQILEVLQDTAEREARTTGLDIVIAFATGFSTRVHPQWPDPTAQKALGSLMETVGGGHLWVRGKPSNADAVFRQLHSAWKTTGVNSLRFIGRQSELIPEVTSSSDPED